MLLKVTGMTCGHCEKAVTRALLALDPAAQVHVDRAGGEVRVEGALGVEQAIAAIREEGYEAALVQA